MLIHINQSNEHIYLKNYFQRDKKDVLLLLPDDTSVEQELRKRICVSVNFYDSALAFKKELKVIDMYDNIADGISNTKKRLY